MLLNNLGIERLNRKSFEICQRYEASGSCWTQTAYGIILYYLLGKANQKAAQRLSSIVPHSMLMRENDALYKIEALLIGASGLLDLYNENFAIPLKQEFEHLAIKYNITPLNISDWQLSGIHLNNHPTLRLAQLAACIHHNSISISNLANCSNNRDVHALFKHSASDYWINTLTRYSNERNVAARVGSIMSSIIAINAVVPLLFTYSNYIESHAINERSLDILHTLNAENNIIIRKWHSYKDIAHNAFESQALIQLSTEYCKRGRCKECPLAKIVVDTNNP